MQKKSQVLIIFLGAFLLVRAQEKYHLDTKVFWHEDFSSGKLPEGWKNIDLYKRGCEWVVTDQPYPGSYQYQRQAPPIASKSRGYHLQYQAGYIVDEDQPSWEKKREFPDAYVQTAGIDCRNRSSVVLRFQQTFRFNDFRKADSAGLYVGISNDGLQWHDVEITNKAASGIDMFTPILQELDISKWAANQPRIFLRFYWRGYFSWYWMVDDIELAESRQRDISIVKLVSHNEASNIFKKDDQLILRIRNCGSQDINSDFVLTAKIDKGPPCKITVPASKIPFASNSEMDIAFPPMDLTLLPTHTLLFQTLLAGDENEENNKLKIKITARATSLGNLTHFEPNSHGAMVSAGVSKVKIIFYNEDVFRIWMAPDGEFTDPAGKDIIVHYPTTNATIQSSDQGAYFRLKSRDCILRVYKRPLRFAMYDRDDAKAIWEESNPIIFGASTIQNLLSKPDEYFYGCGMQNGYFSHRGKDILIEKGGGWDDGGRSNPAPFYMSTSGYGVFRNTFDAGKYSFQDTLRLMHNEDRFDAFYFYGPSLKSILEKYTSLTGKPFFMPRWALSLGDANCYNKLDRQKKPQTTPAVITNVADKYIESNMPRGWILPNDGYGCGYVHLDSVVKELGKRGFHTGLWTENGLSKIATEVGKFGTRLCKLDVAWVGPGYKFALDACKAAYAGIENNCQGRGFVWSVMGWAGTQHYSTIWSGDQAGNWEYIRFHIPTVIGSGLSGFNAATGDVDGIFGGSDSTYVRDLQWKCFTPVFMVMSGWAKKDKQPYAQGGLFSDINRNYLQLKMRMTPYIYTYCYESYLKGVPTVRGMVLEYPNDSVAKGVQTQYQFMTGDWLLVAPVYKSGGKRDSIYLPKGKWIDYWDGQTYENMGWLNNYPAPLDKLPLFVKAGAIIPLYPPMNYDGERMADTLTLDIYPYRHSSFNLYEDDGITRQYQKGAYATTRIEVEAEKKIDITIDAAKGNYHGIYRKRVYLLQIHSTRPPRQVLINGLYIKGFSTQSALSGTKATGYTYDPSQKKGILFIQTGSLSTMKNQQVTIRF